MCGKQKEPHGFVPEFRRSIAHKEKIARGLAHLFVVDIYMPVMAPKTRECAARCTFTLCDLVFMVREDEVNPAAVNVYIGAEIFIDHRRAFYMPPRSAFAPRGLP